MDAQEVARRVHEAFLHAGLLKEAEEPLEDEEATIVEETVKGVDEPTEAESAPVPPPTLINLFQHPDAHPYVLDLALLQVYGPEWLEWERETLEHQIPNDFNTRSVSDLNMSKLQAVKTLHLVDTFWQDWEVFVCITMPLNNLFPDFEVMQVSTVAQCAIAIDIATRIRPGLQWSDEMLAYLEVVHLHDGIACAVENLSFVSVDSEDYPVDCGDVSRRWPFVRKTGKAPTDDSSTSEQLRRLLVIHEAVRESQDQLAAQLPMLLNG